MYSFYLKNDFNENILQVVDMTGNANHLFQFQCQANLETLPKDASGNAIDEGQIWVTNDSPSGKQVTVFNTLSGGFLGITGDKNDDQVVPGIEVGSITFLPESVINRMQFTLVQGQEAKQLYFIQTVKNGAISNEYLLFNADTQTVSLSTVDDLTLLPDSYYPRWKLTEVDLLDV